MQTNPIWVRFVWHLFRCHFFVSLLVFSSTVYADTFRKHMDICYNTVADEWPIKSVEVKTNRDGMQMAVRCSHPEVCPTPFTYVVFEVYYIRGEKVPVTCSIKDGEPPKLDQYNEDDSFMPPG